MKYVAALILAGIVTASAQDYPENYPQNYPQSYAPPPAYSQRQLDNLVSRIALYPDPLLAQIFAAASFPDQIPEAARWAAQYRNLRGEELAAAIYEANLPFDPAVQALLPFPAVLDMMAADLNWTSELGNAVLANRAQVMDAVQYMRRSAEQYGYLRSNPQMRVVNSYAGIEIQPVDPGLIYVPVYDPYVVYAPPRPGFYIGSAIGFGPSYRIGAFGSWGWGGGFNWYNHVVVVNRSVWGRNWENRNVYRHNYGNWDRGEWRNNYYNNRTVIVNNNRPYYGNGGGPENRGWDRGNRAPVQINAPIVQNRNSYYNNPAMSQNRGWDRNAQNNVQNNVPQQNRGYYSAPMQNPGQNNVPPAQNRGYYSAPMQNPGQTNVPPAQNRGYYSAPAQNPVQNNVPPMQNRGYYTAPMQNRAWEHNSAPVQNNVPPNRGYYSAPVQNPVQNNVPQMQNRGNYSAPMQNRGWDRGGMSNYQRPQAPAAAPQNNGNNGFRGNDGGRTDRGSRR